MAVLKSQRLEEPLEGPRVCPPLSCAELVDSELGGEYKLEGSSELGLVSRGF